MTSNATDQMKKFEKKGPKKLKVKSKSVWRRPAPRRKNDEVTMLHLRPL
jgi:hypothetical protein